MLARSDDYLEYCRETAKHARDPHDLALRGRNHRETTRLIHRQIADAVDLHAGDTLLDIGCGDGTMLRMAEELGASATGLLATDEEVDLLRRFGLNAQQGLSDHLPVGDETASVVVCNNVLLVVPREQILASLHEIHRVAKPGARIYLGEIPFVEPHDPTPTFTTRSQLLAHLYRRQGLRAWAGMVRRMMVWQLTGKPAVLNSGTKVSFWSPPEEFIAMASASGLALVRYDQHKPYPTRNNYLFRKAA